MPRPSIRANKRTPQQTGSVTHLLLRMDRQGAYLSYLGEQPPASTPIDDDPDFELRTIGVAIAGLMLRQKQLLATQEARAAQ